MVPQPLSLGIILFRGPFLQALSAMVFQLNTCEFQAVSFLGITRKSTKQSSEIEIKMLERKSWGWKEAMLVVQVPGGGSGGSRSGVQGHPLL